jgi:hypothetical protein
MLHLTTLLSSEFSILLLKDLDSKITFFFRGRKVLTKGAYGDWTDMIEGTPL